MKRGKNSYNEALRIWTDYLAVQKQIEDPESDITISVQGRLVELAGILRRRRWTVEIWINPYDRHSPSIESENAVPWTGDRELWTSPVFCKKSDEALEAAEKKAGFSMKPIINIVHIKGHDTFLPRICDAIDEYDRQHPDEN